MFKMSEARDDNPEIVEADRSFLRASLGTCLKRLDAANVELFVEKMMDDGINKDTAEYVETTNLELLGFDKYQAKALVQHWARPAAGTSTQKPTQTLEQAAGSSNSESSQPGGNLIDISQFKIKWDLVYDQVNEGKVAGDLIKKKQILPPKLRTQVANEIIRQAIVSKVSNLTRETFDHIYYSLVLTKHKETFETKLASGAKSPGGFLYVLKYCFDNQKRTDRNKHLRQVDFQTRQYEQPRGKFSYCCTKWRAKHDVPGQTPETIKEQQAKMKRDYEEIRPKFWDWEQISTMMKNCFKAQREMINKNISDALEQQKKNLARKRKRPAQSQEGEENDEEELTEPQAAPVVTISQVSTEWPFIFCYQGMLLHFEELTGVELEKELENCKGSVKWEVLLDFFKNLDDTDEFYKKTCRQMEKFKSKKPDGAHDLRAIVLMLSKYFKETSFIEVVEETVTLEVLNQQKKAPQYPSLTAPGKDGCLFKAKKFFIGVDSEYHYSFSSFERAACCIYMMYFVFNLDYAPETQITLEFLQRYVFNMDPPQGNKRPAKGQRQGRPAVKYSTKIVHDDVARLTSKLKYLEQLKDKENVSSPEVSEDDEEIEDLFGGE